MKNPLKKFGGCVASSLATLIAASFLAASTTSAQNATLTDGTNLVISADTPVASQAYVDQSPEGGMVLTYTAIASAPFNNANFSTNQLFNGANSPAANQTATAQFYAIINPGTLTLTSTATTESVGALTINFGYSNRLNGTYALTTAMGGDIGAFTINNNGNNTDDDLLLTLKTPVTTTGLVLTFTGTDTASFQDIQVFSVPEPGTYLWVLAGAGLLVGFRKLGRRTA